MNFFNKIISELLAVDVKINEENKALILLRSLPESYEHIITIMLSGKETLILKKGHVNSLIKWDQEKVKSRRARRIRFGGNKKEKKERGGKKSSGSSKKCQIYHRKSHWKKNCKHRQEWLKKKGQAAEANVAEGVSNTNVLMTSYIEDNTS